MNTSGWSPETEFVSLPNIPGPANPGGAGKWYQWLKVREAFKRQGKQAIATAFHLQLGTRPCRPAEKRIINIEKDSTG